MFVSSHLMSEMALTADHLIVVGRGRLIADTTVAEFVAQASGDAAVRVRCADAERAARAARRRRASRVEPRRATACSRSTG